MVRPHKYAYKGIIVYYMVRKQIEYSYDTNIGKFSNDPTFNYRFMRDIKYEPLTQSPTKLYAEIDRMRKKYKWPKMMSWKMLVKYLREMVNEHILVEYPRGHSRNNETHYRLSEYRLYLCLELFFKRSHKHPKSLWHGPIGRRPYMPLLFDKLYIELIRILNLSRFPLRLQKIHYLYVF